MDNFNIGKTIRELRTEHSYSQAQLGELLNVTDSTISKWESGDSNPNIDQISNLAKLFGMSVDELLHYQEKKNAERLRQEAEEKARQAERNNSIKAELKKMIFCKVWDKKEGFCDKSRIKTEYNGETLTLYQKEDPSIVLYDSCIGLTFNTQGKCFTFRDGKWEECILFENCDNRWSIQFDFEHPIERIRFSFDEEGIEDYVLDVKYVLADKEAYRKKVEAKIRKELLAKVNIQVHKSTFNIVIPGNYGSAQNNIFTGIVNVTFDAATAAFSYAVIELYLNKDHLLKTYRLDPGEKIWMEDKICGQYYFRLKQFDADDNLIFTSDLLAL